MIDRQLQRLWCDFEEQGGFSERLSALRKNAAEDDLNP